MGGKAEEYFTGARIEFLLLCSKNNLAFTWAADVVCASLVLIGSESIIMKM